MPRRRPIPAHPIRYGALLACVLLAWGCDDNQTFPTGPGTFDATDTTAPLSCVPNLDGRIDASELTPALGVPISYLIGQDRTVDLTGAIDDLNRRVWRLDGSPNDPVATLAARAAADQWYADSFPGDAVAVPLDLAGAIDGVYRHDADAGTFTLLGVASTEPDPPAGRTLWAYDAPILLYRFPLEDGDAWTSVANVRDGLVNGLPYAARDTYEVSVDGTGRLVLPDLTFTQALRVRTHVVIQPAVGASVTRRQVSFLFECFGEVARATSADGEQDPDFDTAAELRRVGL